MVETRHSTSQSRDALKWTLLLLCLGLSHAVYRERPTSLAPGEEAVVVADQQLHINAASESSMPSGFGTARMESGQAAMARVETNLTAQMDLEQIPREAGDACGLIGVSVLLLVALSPVWFSQGFLAFFSVVMYIVSICFVKIFAKQAFNHGYHFPYTLTAMHMLVTAVVASMFDRPLLKEATSTFKISAVKAASLGLNNGALVFGNAAFISVIGALTPVTTFAVDVARTWNVSLYRFVCISLACAGAAICTGGQAHFSLAALLLSLGADLTRSLKTVWAHDMLVEDVSVYRLAAWTSLWSLLFMLVVGLATEGVKPYTTFAHLDLWGYLGVVVSCIAAAALNILQCVVLKFLGPVVQTLFGSLELLAAIMLAVVMLREEVSRTEWIGVFLVCFGCAVVKIEEQFRSTVTRASKWLSSRGIGEKQLPA